VVGALVVIFFAKPKVNQAWTSQMAPATASPAQSSEPAQVD
jgi:hypothetical protein